MQVTYPSKKDFAQKIRDARTGSLDLVVVVTAALEANGTDEMKLLLAECARALKDDGLIFVHGHPHLLPELGVYLDQRLTFKYWIAIETIAQYDKSGLPSAHAAMLLFVKGSNRFNIERVRLPHPICDFCGSPLRDWGGKKHLMHPDGFVISDVWKYWPSENNRHRISSTVLNTVLELANPTGSGFRDSATSDALIDQQPRERIGVIGPQEGLGQGASVSEYAAQYRLPGFDDPLERYGEDTAPLSNRMFNVVHRGDALKILRRYPDNSIDLVFADPPYNLDKNYNVYDDGREDEHYINWCNSWLQEYVRILKPSGSLYVLNLPRWAMHHAAFLNQHLHFQNWIVWDALSEPRGKLMPAHYALLFYTKHLSSFTFNYDQVSQLDARTYCLRASCVRDRKLAGVDKKEALTDFWWDIHRIKHKRDRDHHPCQLPETLMERIIRLSTNPDDIVLDAFSGAGTTAVVSARMGRRYVAIDMDEKYARLTERKITEVERNGYVRRKPVHRPERTHTKKELQLELRSLAVRLGRLPTPDDVRRLSKYRIQIFYEMFPTWGKALKAAKLEVQE